MEKSMMRMGGFGKYWGLLAMVAVSLGFGGYGAELRAAESAVAGANLVQVRDVFVQAGQTAIVYIDITNVDAFRGFQFDLTLPAGVSYSAGSAALTSRKVDHNIGDNLLESGKWRFLVYSLSNASFQGNSGAVVSIPLTVPSTAGSYPITLSGVTLSYTVGGATTSSASGQVTVYTTPAKLKVKTKMEGWGTGGTMGTVLASSGYLPLTSPYTEAPRALSSFPSGTTDWILLELRTSATGGPVWQQSFLVNQDGYLCETSGVQDLLLGVPPGSYWIVLRHRNHAAVMSAAVFAVVSNSATFYDFTLGADKFYGGGGKLAGSRWSMPCGDLNQDGFITSRDYVAWYRSSSASAGYYTADLNGDGGVTEQDRVLWRANAQAGLRSLVP